MTADSAAPVTERFARYGEAMPPSDEWRQKVYERSCHQPPWTGDPDTDHWMSDADLDRRDFLAIEAEAAAAAVSAREGELRASVEAYDALRSKPVEHRLNLNNLAEPLYGTKSLPYSPNRRPCDYLVRSPARASDCDCGAFDYRGDELDDARDVILATARALLSEKPEADR